jgi:hypothetical protein
MKKLALVLVFLLIPCFSNMVMAQEEGMSFEYQIGGAYNIPTFLKIRQEGYPTINVSSARFSTRPFDGAVYYMVRVGLWKDNSAWEFEFIHHKLYLENKPEEVQQFDLTHGFNLMYINRTLKPIKITEKLKVITRIGAGMILTHPENIVRGMEFKDEGGLNRKNLKGYFFSGGTAQLAYQFRYDLHKMVFIGGEIKFTGSYAKINIRNGDATMPNLTVHGLFGFGIVLN